MDSINQLIEQFRQFPGIGPRQAKRFVYFLLAQPESYRSALIKSLGGLSKHIRVCADCMRFFPIGSKISALCPICGDPNRSDETLVVVSRDVDFENIERSHGHSGKYFILGGSIPILEKEPESRIRLKELIALVEKRSSAVSNKKLKEVILALNLTPEGENTEEFLRAALAPLLEKYSVKISSLGRGLSTGLELEYSDSDTIKNALKNRA